MRDDRDDDDRQQDEPDRKETHGPDVRAEVAQRGEERGPVEERRQHADEDEVGRQVDLGQPGHEPEREAAEHEQDRVRDPQLRDQREHRGAGCEQQEQVEEVRVREVGQARRPLSRNSACADSDFSSSSPIPRRISGAFVNWMSP